jgi:hypothetical protein
MAGSQYRNVVSERRHDKKAVVPSLVGYQLADSVAIATDSAEFAAGRLWAAAGGAGGAGVAATA